MAELHPSAPTQPRAIRALAITAGALIFLLTAVSLWLSYEHLHDVGARHGFADDPIRAWAWPATIDLFYAGGEVLILRAALARRIDWWAISLVIFGAGGSIGLNIAGVGPGAQPLDYVVAAVPPVASLLAFGALMNQIYRALATRRATTPVVAPPAPVMAPVMPPVPTEAPALGPESEADEEVEPEPIEYSDPRCYVIRALYNTAPTPTRPGTKAMRAALVDAGFAAPSDGAIRGQLRAEVEQYEPHLAQLPAAPVAISA